MYTEVNCTEPSPSVRPPWINLFTLFLYSTKLQNTFLFSRFSNRFIISKSYLLTEILSTVDLLIKIPCFVKRENYFLNVKSNLSKLVSTRRSTVSSLPLQQGFLGSTYLHFSYILLSCKTHFYLVNLSTDL